MKPMTISRIVNGVQAGRRAYEVTLSSPLLDGTKGDVVTANRRFKQNRTGPVRFPGGQRRPLSLPLRAVPLARLAPIATRSRRWGAIELVIRWPGSEGKRG